MNLKQSTPTFTEETLDMLNNCEKHANSAHCMQGDVEDVTRRKHLAAVAFQRLWSLWVGKRNISEGQLLRLYMRLYSAGTVGGADIVITVT